VPCLVLHKSAYGLNLSRERHLNAQWKVPIVSTTTLSVCHSRAIMGRAEGRRPSA
jgi:hypothetical protein